MKGLERQTNRLGSNLKATEAVRLGSPKRFQQGLLHTRFCCVSETSVVGGTWVAQSVKRPTSAQVMISWSRSSSPASGSVLTAQGLEPASDSVPLSLFAPPHSRLRALSLKNK